MKLIDPVAIGAVADGPVATLLEVAARKCFGGLAVNWLKKVTLHIKVNLPSGATLFETLMGLVTGVLGVDEGSALDMVCLRVATMKDQDKWCDVLVRCD